MDLYFSPMACSLADRIVVYEAGAEISVRLHQVDMRTKKLADGSDYLAINRMGQVPALRTGEGQILTENAAILMYIADQFPDAGLVPQTGFGRYDVIRWLSFIGSELHMRVFKALVSSKPNEGAKAVALAAAPVRLAYLNEHLSSRDFLLQRFSVADGALFAVLNWARHIEMDLREYGAIEAHYARVAARPAVKRAMQEEMRLLKAA